MAFAQFAKCQAPEGDTKIRIIKCIDERIDGTVYPAEPRQHVHCRFADRVARQKRYQQVVHEERHPARDEATDDHAQRLGRFRLAFRRRYAHRHPFAVAAQTGGGGGDVLLAMHSIGLVHRMEMTVRRVVMPVQIRFGQRRLAGAIVNRFELLNGGELVVGDSGAGADGRRGLGDLDEFVQRFVMRFGTFDRLLAEDLLLRPHRVLALWAVMMGAVIVGRVCVEINVIVDGGPLGNLRAEITLCLR